MPLYAWGANSYGQLGLGYECDTVVEPQQVSLLSCTNLDAKDIVAVRGGAGHTLILDRKGRVYCCGWNKKGQLGISDATMKFEYVEILANFKVVQISCGWDFSAALTHCGKLFVWGSNAHLQLGLSKSITCTGIPSRLQVSLKMATGFAAVSCGLRHMSILTKDGTVLVAGTGTKGQLGTGEHPPSDGEGYLSISKVPDLSEVISVTSGQNHTLALRTDGVVFAWGDNRWGQLGLDPTTTERTFSPREVLRIEGLRSVDAGWTHSAALGGPSAVLTWGRNDYGQLGRSSGGTAGGESGGAGGGPFRPAPLDPSALGGSSPPQQLSLGSEHCVAVTHDGRLFAWGWNEHASCGPPVDGGPPPPAQQGNPQQQQQQQQQFKNVMRPRQVKIPGGKRVLVGFACTGSTFAVVEGDEN